MNESQEITSSSFIFSGEKSMDWTFADHQEIACRGINMLFSATHKGCRYLLKGLRPEYRNDTNYELHMLKEYRLGKSLQHAHVAQTYGLVDDAVAGRCIVMEYIEGCNLKQWLETNPSRGMRHKVFMEMLDALEYCHAKQVIHCDIKPSNIMVTAKGGHVKLIDFGLSDNDNYLIFKNGGGTNGYMAPEQRDPQMATDERTDIYAVGCVMEDLFPRRYRMLSEWCKRENADGRPQSVGVLRKTYVGRRRVLWALAGLALFAVCVALLIICRPEPKETIVTTHVVVHDTVAVAQDSTAAVVEEAPQQEVKKEVDLTQQMSERFDKIYRDEVSQCIANESYTYDIHSEIRRRCKMVVENICATVRESERAYLRSKAESLQAQLDEQYGSQLHECKIAIVLRNR